MEYKQINSDNICALCNKKINPIKKYEHVGKAPIIEDEEKFWNEKDSTKNYGAWVEKWIGSFR